MASGNGSDPIDDEDDSDVEDDYPKLASIDFEISVRAAPWQYDSFVHEFSGDVIVYEKFMEEVEAGKVTLLKVAACEACNERESLFEVCDAHSAFLCHVYESMFEGDDDTKEELDIEPGWNDIIVVSELKVDEPYNRTEIVVDTMKTIMAFFGSSNLVVAPIEDENYHGLQLKMEEWLELGFKKVAGAGLVFRDMLTVNPYKPNPSLDLIDDDETDDSDAETGDED